MNTIGIVAEYNPFHTGHAHQIVQSRRFLGEDSAVAAVMSGNWVQQADCAVADKWSRAELALMGGVDLVLELPTPWAVSSAESFARGAVSILHAAGVVDHLSFGSECGRVEPLAAAAACLETPAYRAALSRYLDKGLSFPAARQRGVEEILGEGADVLSTPNNNLGVEYIRALNALHSPIRPITVPRRGAAHNSLTEPGETRPDFLSATQIRRYLRAGDWDGAQPWLVPGGRTLLEGSSNGLADLGRVSRAMLAKVRTMTAGDWAVLPDSGAAEGLPQRLEQAGQRCTSMEEFYELAKTKRYTHARLRRLALWAWLGLTAADIPAVPPYIRVLGFNDRGRELLREMKEKASLPILTKPAHARELEEEGRRLFALEARCTDLYDLCLAQVPVPGREWTTGPVIRMHD